MKIRFVVLGLLSVSCQGAAFRNLDFQSPNIRVLARSEPWIDHLVKDVIPGWHLQFGGVEQNLMLYNNSTQLFANAILQGPRVPRVGDIFMFHMNTGISFDFSYENMASASIYQVGQVPASAKSIHFHVGFGFHTSIHDFHVTINNTLLPLIEYDAMEHTIHYQADVSSWAGGTAELRFTVEPDREFNGFHNYVGLGAIEFSPIPVPAIPEPSTWALLATGLAALGWATRNSR